MKTIYFKCKLLTDIVLNQRAATEGNQESLDFIPGNNFLGIAAAKLYHELAPSESLLAFHSGKIRFGDAHPEKDGKRALRIPASFYKSKLGSIKDGLYVSHEVEDPEDQTYKDFQPKQCRTGFYVFDNGTMEEIQTEKSFSIKSAYDREKRRSKDKMMYGYESLVAGSSWLFDVNIDDDVDIQLIEKIKSSLTGKKRVGRSRTAQYGLVEISENKCMASASASTTGENLFIYADARLIFLDEYEIPAFQPTAEQLGFKDGTIDWSKSQIRTFQYAPWNYKRQTREADRCGIEKGSVFVVIPSDNEHSRVQESERWVGNYQNEGFGRVMINPDFLQAESNSNGKAKYRVSDKSQGDESVKTSTINSEGNELLKFLERRKNQKISEQNIQKEVNDFVAQDKNKHLFIGDSFASQWGAIRSIAMRYKSKKEIKLQLFDKKTIDNKPDAYLTHGVAKDKWDERKRREKFKEFCEKFKDEDFQSAVINLSAEMAKHSKKGGKR